MRAALDSGAEVPGVFTLGQLSISGGGGGSDKAASRVASSHGGSGGGSMSGGATAGSTLTVPGGAALQLPVRFTPSLLREAAAVVSVELLEPSIPAPAPLVWRLPVQGIALADTRGIAFT